MAAREPAVIVKDLYKTFRLPHEKHSGIKQAAVGIFKGNKGFETQKVLNDISFEIKQGEFFGIVGRNGSGKSTLLKLLAGIYTPDKGLVQVKGSLMPFIELGVGFNPELTGRENVYMNGALLGFGHEEMDAMYDDIVAFAEIEKFMDQKLKNYSSGMQVRLAFSIAIKSEADILLIDEVLAVGDVVTVQIVQVDLAARHLDLIITKLPERSVAMDAPAPSFGRKHQQVKRSPGGGYAGGSDVDKDLGFELGEVGHGNPF